MDDLIRDFIQQHMADDLHTLLLSASRYPGIDIPFVVEQIASRRQIREKLPQWYANDHLIFPAKITVEQSSSEGTGHYKQQFVVPGQVVCDLTGGLGVDSFYLSRNAGKLIYVERFESYCEAASHNFTELGRNNIEVIREDAREYIRQCQPVDLFYLDPARRGKENSRVYALADCEPDLVEILPALFKKAPKVIAKLSPMVDITQALQLLPATTEIHVLSIKNECKELLFVMERDKKENPVFITCWNQRSDQTQETFIFTLEEEKNRQICLADQPETYLYEPNSSLLKAGAFKSVLRPGLKKLHVSSHLYTSAELLDEFPGRIFKTEEVIPFHGKRIKKLADEIPRANMTVRNFPHSVQELRKRTRIREGGEVYLFATRLANDEWVLIKTRKVR